MENEIYFSEGAEIDLFDIYVYSDKAYSKEKAETTLKSIRQKVEKLKVFPEMGNYPPELERINLYNFREVHTNPFRIIYEVMDKIIYIHCILDGRRDVVSILLERVIKH
ncbi:MAG: type II toxin-antitoxin system RelE/ParE family toxin [Spirochaetes bacterium]|nr:MAG: type II toxin-antitoxin system RelE/ParE family toxin [Spirochaetota bacterium]